MAGLQDTRVDVLYTLDETIAKDIFEGVTYPWEVLPKISAFIVALGNTLQSARSTHLPISTGLPPTITTTVSGFTASSLSISSSCS